MTLSGIALIILGAAIIIQVIYLILKSKSPDPVSHFLIAVSFILLLISFIIRSIEIQFPAITNTFESLIFFSCVICLVLALYRFISRDKTFPLIMFVGTIIAALLLAIASSPLFPKEAMPPIPALQSAWLALHVACAFIGEAFFTVSFAASIIYLFTKNEEKKKSIEKVIYTTVIIGYPIFTAGALIFGAIWAQVAWSRFWGWDPKETWAFITWLTYTVFLHTRFIKKFRGKISAILSIVGFLFTLFTFFGVNYLLAGLHSYG